MAKLRKIDVTDAGVENQPLGVFEVDLAVFQGPFDLLLQLIARRQLDITEVALAEVTDEFIAHMRKVPDLSTATEFLVVAATLLDMKAAQLLPSLDEGDQEIDDELSARDLLFSRLLQYRAFKEASVILKEKIAEQALVFPRNVTLEPQFASLLPELLWNTSAEELANLANLAMEEKPSPDQADHIARPGASLDYELEVVKQRLLKENTLNFRDLVIDAENSAVVVTRFLAVLELFRQKIIEFTQIEPLAPLTISMVGSQI